MWLWPFNKNNDHTKEQIMKNNKYTALIGCFLLQTTAYGMEVGGSEISQLKTKLSQVTEILQESQQALTKIERSYHRQINEAATKARQEYERARDSSVSGSALVIQSSSTGFPSRTCDNQSHLMLLRYNEAHKVISMQFPTTNGKQVEVPIMLPASFQQSRYQIDSLAYLINSNKNFLSLYESLTAEIERLKNQQSTFNTSYETYEKTSTPSILSNENGQELKQVKFRVKTSSWMPYSSASYSEQRIAYLFTPPSRIEKKFLEELVESNANFYAYKQSIDQEKLQLENRCDTLRNSLSTLEGKVNELESNIRNKDYIIEQLSNDKTNLTGIISKSEEERRRLTFIINSNNDKISDLNQSYNLKETEVNRLNSTIQQAKSMVMPELENHLKEIREKNDTIRQLKKRLCELERENISPINYEDLFKQKAEELLRYQRSVKDILRKENISDDIKDAIDELSFT